LSGQIKPGRSIGVQTLTQGGTRRNADKPKSTHEEGVAPKILDGVEVVFAQTQQGQVTFKERISLLATPELTGNAGSTSVLRLMCLRYLPKKARPAWELSSYGVF